MMNSTKKKWPPEGFMRVSEVAVAYFPSIIHTTSATRRFRQEVVNTPGMLEELEKTGYTPETHELSPLQTGIITRYWGAPAQVELLLEEDRSLRVQKLHRDRLFD